MQLKPRAATWSTALHDASSHLMSAPSRRKWREPRSKACCPRSSPPSPTGDFAAEDHEPFFTTAFGLDRDFYRGRRILDVGCGPHQRLEWATMAAERVGLDPLAEEYRRLVGEYETGPPRYAKGSAERMPFADASFDIVTSFNSLDHVRDVEAAAAEIKRVLRPGGSFPADDRARPSRAVETGENAERGSCGGVVPARGAVRDQ